MIKEPTSGPIDQVAPTSQEEPRKPTPKKTKLAKFAHKESLSKRPAETKARLRCQVEQEMVQESKKPKVTKGKVCKDTTTPVTSGLRDEWGLMKIREPTPLRKAIVELRPKTWHQSPTANEILKPAPTPRSDGFPKYVNTSLLDVRRINRTRTSDLPRYLPNGKKKGNKNRKNFKSKEFVEEEEIEDPVEPTPVEPIPVESTPIELTPPETTPPETTKPETTQLKPTNPDEETVLKIDEALDFLIYYFIYTYYY